MKIKVNERQHGLQDVEDAIDHQALNLLLNWCLVWVAENNSQYSDNHNHWLNELRDGLIECMDEIYAADYSISAINKRVDKALRDAKVTDPNKAKNLIRVTFIDKEHLTHELLDASITAWITNGVSEITAVLKQEKDLLEYIQGKIAFAPPLTVRKGKKR